MSLTGPGGMFPLMPPTLVFRTVPVQHGDGIARGFALAESADKGRFQRGGSRGRIAGGATGRSKAN